MAEKRVNYSSGAPLEEKVGYSRMVKVGDHIYVGGTTSVQPDGTVYGENAYEQTGEVSEPRKSPRHYTVYDAFTELYKIKQYLNHPQLTVKLVLMDMQEYKTLQQRIRTKKGIRRHGEKKDRIPIGIREIVTIEQLEDYMQFVPYELDGTFTSADFAKAAHIPVDTARITLNILKDTQTVTRVGKQGRSYLYEVKENNRCM